MTISVVKAARFTGLFSATASGSIDTGTGSYRKARAWVGGTADTSSVPQSVTIGSDTLTAVGSQQTGPGTASVKWRLYESTSDLTVTGTQTATGTVSPGPGSGSTILLVEIYQGTAGSLTFGTPVFSNPESGSGGSVSSSVTAAAGDKAVMLLCSTASTTISATSPATLNTDLGTTDAASAIRSGAGGSTSVGVSFSAAYGAIAAAYSISEPSAAPALTSPTATATGPTQATIGLTTDTAPTTTAISYQILPAATGAPSASTIVGAPDGTISTGSVGALTKAITGLTTNTAVKAHFAQGTTSNVVSTASFTPNTAASSGSPSAQTGTAGGGITWAGVTPDSLVTNHGNGSGAWSIVSSAGFTVAPSINTSTGVLSGGTLSSAGTYAPQIRYTDSSTVPSAQQINFTLSLTVSGGGGGGGGDTAPPTMSAASVTGGTLSATGSITSNEAGTLWWKMDGSATATDPGAGNESGAGWTSQSMLASANSVNFSTQPAGTRYGHFLGIDAAGNRAAVVNASGTVSGSGGGLATSVSITLTTDGTTPAANLTGLKVAVYDQATPDLWAGHAPIYATASGTTNGSGVLTCNITGLTSLAPGALAGLVVSNSDGTLTQGAAQKGYVGPALVS